MKRTGIIALLLSLVTLATFSFVIRNDFVQWDDNLNITGNPHIQQLNGQELKWMFTDTTLMRRYVPLAWLNWALLHALFGLNPLAFHLEALLLHMVNGVLIFLLLQKLLRVRSSNQTPEDALRTDIAAAIGALIWAVHPLRTEAVGWANCVLYPQSLLFALCSIHCYLCAAETSAKRAPWFQKAFWWSVFFFVCSLLTYPTAIAFVVVLLAVDVYALRRTTTDNPGYRYGFRQLVVEKTPFIVVTLAVAAVTLWARANMSGIWTETARVDGFGWDERIAQGFFIWAWFLWKPWWPADLAPVYTHLIGFKSMDWPFVLSITGIVAISAGLFVNRRRWPIPAVLWTCYLVLLVPMLGLTEHPHYPNDRYSYLAGIIWSVVIAGALWKCRAMKVRFVAASTVALGICAFLIVASFNQTKIWKDSETLFKTTIARLGDDPYRCDLQWRLGLFYAQQNKNNAALAVLEEAAKLSPGSPHVNNDMAAVLIQQGRTAEAIIRYEEVLKKHPDHALTHKNLAAVLVGEGRLSEASTHYDIALRTSPKNAELRMNYAALLSRMGRATEAVDQALTAVKLQPDSAQAHFNAGNVLMSQQRAPEALGEFKAAAMLKPDFAEAHQNAGTVLAMGGNIAEALPYFLTVTKLKPEQPEGHFACGLALTRLGRTQEATAKFQSALQTANALGRRDLVTQIEAQMRMR